jgi:hypothetical protein
VLLSAGTLAAQDGTVLRAAVEAAADDVRVRRAEAQAPVLRRYAETRYQAKSWSKDRRVAARIEASTLGLDIRFVVTSLASGSAEWVYDTLYCARGQAENLIKMHKSQLASDRTSCRSPDRSTIGNSTGRRDYPMSTASEPDLETRPRLASSVPSGVWLSSGKIKATIAHESHHFCAESHDSVASLTTCGNLIFMCFAPPAKHKRK